MFFCWYTGAQNSECVVLNKNGLRLTSLVKVNPRRVLSRSMMTVAEDARSIPTEQFKFITREWKVKMCRIFCKIIHT